MGRGGLRVKGSHIKGSSYLGRGLNPKGGWAGGVGGGVEGYFWCQTLQREPNLPGPGKPSAFGSRSPTGGTHSRQTKGVDVWLWVWGGGFGACSQNLDTSGPRPRRIMVVYP